MDLSNILLAVAVMAIVTAGTRFLPFLVFSKGQTPAWVTYLGARLPYAMMGMLVVYALRGVRLASPDGFLPELIAGSGVVLIYLASRNSLLSILAGTLGYMFLVQVVFI